MIHTYLDLSTAHLTRDTAGRLDSILPENRAAKLQEWGWPAMTIAPYDCGWFVTVPAAMTNAQMDALPSDLEEVLSYAHHLGVHLVRFDADGGTVDGLPTYDIWGQREA